MEDNNDGFLQMSPTTIWIVAAIVLLLVILWYGYQRYKSAHTVATLEDLIDFSCRNIQVEKLDMLKLSDVTYYLKSLNLKKGDETPFIAKHLQNGETCILIASLKEKTMEISNEKLILPQKMDDELEKIFGAENFVTLN